MPTELPPLPRTAVPENSTVDDDVASPLLQAAAWDSEPQRGGMKQKWRRPLGLVLLFFTVVLWTTSNFLASTLFADNTYSKPYFVTYINTSFFIIPLIPILIKQAWSDPASFRSFFRNFRSRMTNYKPVAQDDDDDDERILKPDSPRLLHSRPSYAREDSTVMPSPVQLQPSPETTQPLSSSASSLSDTRLDLHATARLSLEFCILWFLANYFVAACLHYTTVASSTILTSTSSVFTLLFGTLFRVETFTIRKLVGVCVSLAGIALISTVDLSGASDDNRGSFPHKSIREVAIGDAMALVSAVLYGLYAVFMKKRIGDESRVNMPLFFGLVGLFNVLLLWPGFFVLHFLKIEPFELPPDGRVLRIIMVNSASSLVSDFAWAYAVLLTSPIVVTVGLSTTIPLSLIGQMVLNDQTASVVYWVGALGVVGSFVIVNHEGKAGEEVGISDEGSVVRRNTAHGLDRGIP